MIQSFAARACSFNRDGQILFNFGLPDEFRQPLRTQLQLKRRIILNRRSRNNALAVFRNFRNILQRSHWQMVSVPTKRLPDKFKAVIRRIEPRISERF